MVCMWRCTLETVVKDSSPRRSFVSRDPNEASSVPWAPSKGKSKDKDPAV